MPFGNSWFFIPPKSCLTFTFVIVLNIFGRYLENELTSFLSVLQINWVNKILRGGWSGFGMVTVGMDPTSITILNGHPTKIPPDKILGGVVQNCPRLLSLGEKNICHKPASYLWGKKYSSKIFVNFAYLSKASLLSLGQKIFVTTRTLISRRKIALIQ